jgi:hypothetical protein
MSSWFESVTNAVLETLNEAAKSVSSLIDTSSSSSNCPANNWTLKIQVVSAEQGKWPTDSFSVGLVIPGQVRIVDPSGNLRMTSENSLELTFTGTGPKSGQPKAFLRTWDQISCSDANVSLDSGDSKTVTITIQSKPWIAFHVVDSPSGKAIPSVVLTVDTPGQPQRKRNSDDQPVLVEFLDRGATCKIEQMVHPEDEWIWYVEEFTSQ